nr:hypothetical protein [Tanacetum cinerariifolium]
GEPSPPPQPTFDTTHQNSAASHGCYTATTTAATAFPADVAVVAGYGWRIGHHRRGAVHCQKQPSGGGRTTVQPHLVVSSRDGATLEGVSRWYMLSSLDGTGRGYQRMWNW